MYALVFLSSLLDMLLASLLQKLLEEFELYFFAATYLSFLSLPSIALPHVVFHSVMFINGSSCRVNSSVINRAKIFHGCQFVQLLVFGES